MKMKRLWLLCGVALLGCQPAEPTGGAPGAPAVGEQSAGIIGGVVDNNDTPVGRLLMTNPPGRNSWSCTGTLVSDMVILTAAHCVISGPDPVTDVVDAQSQFTFQFTDPATGILGPQLPITSVSSDPVFSLKDLSAGHDLGIAILTYPQVGHALLPFSGATLSSTIKGTNMRIIGYGSSTHTNTGGGTKRSVTTTVADLTAGDIVIGDSSHQMCHGDSGGPALLTINGAEAIVAINSFINDPRFSCVGVPAPCVVDVCENGGSHSRLDLDVGLLDQAIQNNAPIAVLDEVGLFETVEQFVPFVSSSTL